MHPVLQFQKRSNAARVFHSGSLHRCGWSTLSEHPSWSNLRQTVSASAKPGSPVVASTPPLPSSLRLCVRRTPSLYEVTSTLRWYRIFPARSHSSMSALERRPSKYPLCALRLTYAGRRSHMSRMNVSSGTGAMSQRISSSASPASASAWPSSTSCWGRSSSTMTGWKPSRRASTALCVAPSAASSSSISPLSRSPTRPSRSSSPSSPESSSAAKWNGLCDPPRSSIASSRSSSSSSAPGLGGDAGWISPGGSAAEEATLLRFLDFGGIAFLGRGASSL